MAGVIFFTPRERAVRLAPEVATNPLVSLQGKGRVRRSAYPSPTSPVAVRLPAVTDVPEETVSSEDAMEMEVTEQQQVAMQQEEKVLTEQIESLQKEK